MGASKIAQLALLPVDSLFLSYFLVVTIKHYENPTENPVQNKTFQRLRILSSVCLTLDALTYYFSIFS